MATRFITVSIEIMHDKNLSPNQKFIFSEIEQLTELDKGCIASNRHFSELVGITTMGVSKAINDLAAKGYIYIDNAQTKRNFGRIITINSGKSGINSGKSGINSGKSGINSGLETKENKTMNKTMNEDIKEKPTVKKILTVQKKDLVEAHPLKENIKEFIEHRKQIKKTMSDLALSKFINKINDFESKGINTRKCIDDAIEAGYQTIYEPKTQNKQFTSKQDQDHRHRAAIEASVSRLSTNQVNISEDPFVADFDPSESFYE